MRVETCHEESVVFGQGKSIARLIWVGQSNEIVEMYFGRCDKNKDGWFLGGD